MREGYCPQPPVAGLLIPIPCLSWLWSLTLMGSGLVGWSVVGGLPLCSLLAVLRPTTDRVGTASSRVVGLKRWMGRCRCWMFDVWLRNREAAAHGGTKKPGVELG